jgi:hypothetical protein
MHSKRPCEIRQLVQQQFAEHSPACGPIREETLLIRDGQYCGHRYRTEDLTAVWFLEEDQIKMYDRNGRVIAVVCPSEILFERRSEAA